MHYSAQRRHGRRHGSRECWVPAFCVCSLPLCFSSVITWRGKMWQKPSKQVDSTIRMHKLLQASINTNSGINKFAKPQPQCKTLVIPLHIYQNIRVATFCLTLVCHINLQSYLLQGKSKRGSNGDGRLLIRFYYSAVTGNRKQVLTGRSESCEHKCR